MQCLYPRFKFNQEYMDTINQSTSRMPMSPISQSTNQPTTHLSTTAGSARSCRAWNSISFSTNSIGIMTELVVELCGTVSCTKSGAWMMGDEMVAAESTSTVFCFVELVAFAGDIWASCDAQSGELLMGKKLGPISLSWRSRDAADAGPWPPFSGSVVPDRSLGFSSPFLMPDWIWNKCQKHENS